jgi:hypothetical protein
MANAPAGPDSPTGGTTGGGNESDTKQVAKQEGEQVAEDAREQTQELAESARESAVEVAEEAKHQAIDLAEDARRQLHDQARQQTDNLGNAIQDLGTKLHALADGRTDEAGQVDDYADRLADQVDRIGGRVQELGFDGTIDELQRFARRRPGMFLLGAAAAGFAVSRLGRGAKDAQAEQPGPARGLADEGYAQDRSLMSSEQRDVPARAGQPPLTGQPPVAGQPAAPRTDPPTVGGLPTDVPPPPPAVPAPDPTMPRGRP